MYNLSMYANTENNHIYIYIYRQTVTPGTAMGGRTDGHTHREENMSPSGEDI